MVELGVENVLLFFGEKGVIFFMKDRVIWGNLLKGKVVNIVCVGDVMLGIFLVEYMNWWLFDEMLCKSIVVGSFIVFCKGLIDFLDVEELSK